MAFKTILFLAALAVGASAAPAKSAVCSKGRLARNAVVRILIRDVCAFLTRYSQCCQWFDILDDIQENLYDSIRCP